MPTYAVTMQSHDMQTGEVTIEESTYTAGWNPEKVPTDEIARCAAAEETCKYGFMPSPQGGSMPRVKFVGLTAAIIEPEEELTQLAEAQ